MSRRCKQAPTDEIIVSPGRKSTPAMVPGMSDQVWPRAELSEAALTKRY